MHKDTASQVQFHCSFLPGSVPLQMSLKIAMYCFFLMLPIILTESPIRFDEKHPQNIKLPPPYRGDNILEQISLTILPWKVFDKITLFFYFIRLSFIFRMNMIFRKFHIRIQMVTLQKREHFMTTCFQCSHLKKPYPQFTEKHFRLVIPLWFFCAMFPILHSSCSENIQRSTPILAVIPNLGIEIWTDY